MLKESERHTRRSVYPLNRPFSSSSGSNLILWSYRKYGHSDARIRSVPLLTFAMKLLRRGKRLLDIAIKSMLTYVRFLSKVGTWRRGHKRYAIKGWLNPRLLFESAFVMGGSSVWYGSGKMYCRMLYLRLAVSSCRAALANVLSYLCISID